MKLNDFLETLNKLTLEEKILWKTHDYHTLMGMISESKHDFASFFQYGGIRYLFIKNDDYIIELNHIDNYVTVQINDCIKKVYVNNVCTTYRNIYSIFKFCSHQMENELNIYFDKITSKCYGNFLKPLLIKK